MRLTVTIIILMSSIRVNVFSQAIDQGPENYKDLFIKTMNSMKQVVDSSFLMINEDTVFNTRYVLKSGKDNREIIYPEIYRKIIITETDSIIIRSMITQDLIVSEERNNLIFLTSEYTSKHSYLFGKDLLDYEQTYNNDTLILFRKIDYGSITVTRSLQFVFSDSTLSYEFETINNQTDEVIKVDFGTIVPTLHKYEPIFELEITSCIDSIFNSNEVNHLYIFSYNDEPSTIDLLSEIEVENRDLKISIYNIDSSQLDVFQEGEKYKYPNLQDLKCFGVKEIPSLIFNNLEGKAIHIPIRPSIINDLSKVITRFKLNSDE